MATQSHLVAAPYADKLVVDSQTATACFINDLAVWAQDFPELLSILLSERPKRCKTPSKAAALCSTPSTMTGTQQHQHQQVKDYAAVPRNEEGTGTLVNAADATAAGTTITTARSPSIAISIPGAKPTMKPSRGGLAGDSLPIYSGHDMTLLKLAGAGIESPQAVLTAGHELMLQLERTYDDLGNRKALAGGTAPDLKAASSRAKKLQSLHAKEPAEPNDAQKGQDSPQ